MRGGEVREVWESERRRSMISREGVKSIDSEISGSEGSRGRVGGIGGK